MEYVSSFWTTSDLNLNLLVVALYQPLRLRFEPAKRRR
jgi:hypothetical protein